MRYHVSSPAFTEAVFTTNTKGVVPLIYAKWRKRITPTKLETCIIQNKECLVFSAGYSFSSYLGAVMCAMRMNQPHIYDIKEKRLLRL